MDDQRTMAQLLEAPTAGYEDAIVVPEIAADNFELMHGLLNLVKTSNSLRIPVIIPPITMTKRRSSCPLPEISTRSLATMKFPDVPDTSTPGISSEVAELKDMATTGNVYRDNIQEYVSQAAAANYNQGNTGYRAPISNQIRPPGFPPNHNVQNQGNNQNRYNQNRGNFNQAPAYQPPVNQGQIYRPQVVQPPAYQAPAYQAPAPQTQGVSKTDFDSYVKANDAVMRNMQNQNQVLQTQGQNLQAQLNNLATSNQRLESMLALLSR
ncbi:hypothetical protein Tco_1405569 [Tanacetum coccineum]